jgi:hypothetical protein
MHVLLRKKHLYSTSSPSGSLRQREINKKLRIAQRMIKTNDLWLIYYSSEKILSKFEKEEKNYIDSYSKIVINKII